MRDYANETTLTETPRAEAAMNQDAVRPMAHFVVGTTANLFSSKLVSLMAVATQIALSFSVCVALVLAVWFLTV